MAIHEIRVDWSKTLLEEPGTGHNRWHPDIPPVARCQPGDEVVLETRDAFDGQMAPDMPLAVVAAPNLDVVHPLTGPVYVEGAEPGDVLAVEILTAARQIRAATGADPAPLFRFPFGDADQRTIAVANRAGYVPVRWTVDTLGWEGRAGGISAAVVRARVLAALQPGEIVLMHIGSNPDDGTTFDAAALPQLISQLRARGYSFVTLDALVG